MWTSPGGLPSQALLTTQNPIFIRGTQQDGQQMFIQNAPPQAMAAHNRKYLGIEHIRQVVSVLLYELTEYVLIT